MLYLDKNGEFQDTHESFNNEREEEIQRIGDEIIEEFEEYYCDNCSVHTYSDYSGECCAPGVYVDYVDTPDYDTELQSTILDHIDEKTMTDDFIEDLKEYVFDNVASEDDLYDRVVDNYEPPEPDYDDYGD